jgi:hypothetical protein
MVTRARHRLLVVGCLLGLMGLSIGVINTATIGVADAAEDLSINAAAVYTIDPAASTVHVHTTYVLEELKPNQGGSYFYFPKFSTFAVSAMSNLVVTGNGAPLTFTTEPQGEYQRIIITFAKNLRYGRPQTVDVQYDLTGSTPRTAATPPESTRPTQHSGLTPSAILVRVLSRSSRLPALPSISRVPLSHSRQRATRPLQSPRQSRTPTPSS